MILSDNETKADLLNYEAVATTMDSRIDQFSACVGFAIPVTDKPRHSLTAGISSVNLKKLFPLTIV
jgi:hypothetical protein